MQQYAAPGIEQARYAGWYAEINICYVEHYVGSSWVVGEPDKCEIMIQIYSQDKICEPGVSSKH